MHCECVCECMCKQTHSATGPSRSLCTGMISWPKKRLMIGRLLANLSFTSISSTSVIRATKVYFCMGRESGYGATPPNRIAFFLLFFCQLVLTSPCHTGLVVLAMMDERLSWPWWVNLGRPLLLPGWIDIFRYGSGLKNMPFFRPIARMSADDKWSRQHVALQPIKAKTLTEASKNNHFLWSKYIIWVNYC